jgi:hypothetical protein
MATAVKADLTFIQRILLNGRHLAEILFRRVDTHNHYPEIRVVTLGSHDSGSFVF